MNSRVGGKRKRISRDERKIQICKAMRVMQNYNPRKPITMRRVAYAIGLSPSQYVLDILHELENRGWLSVVVAENSWGNIVYHWSLTTDAPPWDIE